MIVVVGESLIDIVVDPDGDTVEEVGGSPLNVAIGISRLEVPSLLITEVGNDDRGGRIVEHITASGAELVGVPTRSGTTPTATARLDDTGLATYDFELAWNLPHQELPACDALHVGSLGTLLEPGRDSVRDLIEQAWARGVTVSYDPNVREAFLDDVDQAWRDIESIADRATLVKISDEDIEKLHPGADPADIARSLLEGERTELVIVTRGPEGASAYTADAEAHVGVPELDLIDTVGAGDSFTAACLTILYDAGALDSNGGGMPNDTETLETLLRGSVEVAAITCSRRGANPPTRAELPDGWPAGT